MKIEILNVKENPLFKRKEFEVKVTHNAATPSISEIRKMIAASKNIDKGTIIIDSFKSKYGSRETLGTVKIYQTKERALEIEPKHRLIKNGLIEITEENPKEPEPKEKKEEAKEEAKPPEKTEKEYEKKPKDEDKLKKKEVKKKTTKPVEEEATAEKEAKAKPEAKKKGKEKPKDEPEKRKDE